MSLPTCFWDVCACCVCLSRAVTQTGVCLLTAQHVHAAWQENEILNLFHCWSCSLFHTWDHDESWWTPELLLQFSPWCYTDFEITSSVCALGLNFWPISIVDFMLIVKQVVSITFLLICLPKTCNIEMLSEESLHCPALLPDISACIWHNLIKVSPNWGCLWIKWILHLFEKKKN